MIIFFKLKKKQQQKTENMTRWPNDETSKRKEPKAHKHIKIIIKKEKQ